MRSFFLYLLLAPLFSFSQEQIGSDINGEARNDKSGTSVSLSADGSIVAIGAPDNQSGLNAHSGHVRVYKYESNSWRQIGKDIDGIGNTDFSGKSVSLSANGNIVAIGANGNRDNGWASGHVRVFEYKNNIWTQIGDNISGESDNDQSGITVSLSGDGNILAIGAYLNDGNGTDSGHVRVYQNISGSWTQIGTDIDGEFRGDQSGSSLSLSSNGNVLAIGSIINNASGTESGHVRIFENNSGVWTQIGKDIDGENPYDSFGSSISLSSDGKIIAIGAIYNNGNGEKSGNVRVFENNLENWIQIGNDIVGEKAFNRFGSSVSLSEDGKIIAIGAIKNGDNGINSGHVRMYKNIYGSWIQIGNDIDGENSQDSSGRSISLSADGKIVAIGAPLNDARGENSGHVRVYDVNLDTFSSTSINQDYFSYYPNPVKNEVNLILNSGLELKQVNIYNIQSQYLFSIKESKIDVTHLSSGMYLFEVETNQGKSAKKILIE
ncbi:T9SS type A sorting domain-containing protein [Algibacter pectinivorans]|uniref:Por secretion system C-terminal sorting domain-containing protein n=1 Tax=Algibacter pectinivorans TaxID=870482 RepID=A0A1I1NGD8_9FLAO|nr:T9SS type A sorting domain-containing protein [Algibacter pectinivorans]SFC96555.1 Por secretion system C-terminal sorting domain-containing protein [Algibacter pectinivorans]